CQGDRGQDGPAAGQRYGPRSRQTRRVEHEILLCFRAHSSGVGCTSIVGGRSKAPTPTWKPLPFEPTPLWPLPLLDVAISDDPLGHSFDEPFVLADFRLTRFWLLVSLLDLRDS